MFEHIFALSDRALSLAYAGTNLTFTRFVGPGRPEAGHLQPCPQIKLTPAPDPATLPPGQPSAIIVEGAANGRSRSGLTCYGEMGDETAHERLGRGHILWAEGPVRLVTMARPTGSRREAHLATNYVADVAEMTGLPVLWRCGDACAAAYLCGRPRTHILADMSEGGAYHIETRWLPTRTERLRMEAHGFCGQLLGVLRSLLGDLRQDSDKDAAALAPMAPWDQWPSDDLLAAVRRLLWALSTDQQGWLLRWGTSADWAEAIKAAVGGIEAPLTEDDRTEDDLATAIAEVIAACRKPAYPSEQGWQEALWEGWDDPEDPRVDQLDEE